MNMASPDNQYASNVKQAFQPINNVAMEQYQIPADVNSKLKLSLADMIEQYD